jgi:malate dehydrogenase (oxaloacetate-decarboxylating)(NADP+)
MDIPVFHDDQHGTAIIAAAGLINALHLTGRDIKDTKWSATAPARRRSPVSN